MKISRQSLKIWSLSFAFSWMALGKAFPTEYLKGIDKKFLQLWSPKESPSFILKYLILDLDVKNWCCFTSNCRKQKSRTTTDVEDDEEKAASTWTWMWLLLSWGEKAVAKSASSQNDVMYSRSHQKSGLGRDGLSTLLNKWWEFLPLIYGLAGRSASSHHSPKDPRQLYVFPENSNNSFIRFPGFSKARNPNGAFKNFMYH